MAQSRPPAIRSNTGAASPPPLSPRTATGKDEKHSKSSHHHRRKSGQNHTHSERKASRPAPLSRRTTPQYVPKVGPGFNGGKTKEAPKEREDADGESFPQFCMSCERQIQSSSNTFLYCSEACRVNDLHSPTTPPLTPHNPTSLTPSRYSFFSSADQERDIIPRASPTQSRPRSYFNSEPYAYSTTSGFRPSNPTTSSSSRNSKSSTALASLRELATALPQYPSSSSTQTQTSSSLMEKSSSAVWSYMPFTQTTSSSSVKYAAPVAYAKSHTATPTPSTTPGNSYTASYAQAYYSNGGGSASGSRRGSIVGNSNADAYAAMGISAGAVGMERPLPHRYGGSTSHRPRSVDLVTPFPAGF